ncbi:MAG: ATP-binding cassette domain-containing protein, partial [Actinomyces sp.]|nr:ATP-binding cassette domain-containing protein [Actinomyces sp.]
ATSRGLVLDQVRFSYGRNRVLDIDHLEFPAGRICVLVGDNGAGKTTLARLLCGLVREDRGSRITLDSRPASARTRTASSYIVMQDVHRQLFSETVRAEVTLGLSRSERREVDPEDLLARFGLSELAERHPLSLSGGQKQRLVLASAMACHKAVHIFDEPTSGVDERHLVGIAAQLRELADQGAVVIVITHDLELLDACADRIVTLRPLRDIDEGAPQVTVQDLLPSREDRTPDLLTTDRIGRHA